MSNHFLLMPAVGVDVVDVHAFWQQVQIPGTVFQEVFSAAEKRHARATYQYGSSPYAEHLAGRWAAKEAILKALEQARYGQPPLLKTADLSEIRVKTDPWGRLAPAFHGQLGTIVADAQMANGSEPVWSLSISHDGPVATAVAMLTGV